MSTRDQSWRVLLKIVLKGIKVRFYWEPRDLFIGAFIDVRGSELNLWICLIPMFPLQIAFPVAEEGQCACGHRHSILQPPWCRELIEVKAQRDALKQLYENPFFMARIRRKQTEKV